MCNMKPPLEKTIQKNTSYILGYILGKSVLIYVTVFVFALMGNIEHIYANSQKEKEVQKTPSSIGVSFQHQRTREIVKVKDVFYNYGREQHIDVKIRFSDNDDYLQAYQIKNLVDSSIDILIIYADSSEAIIKALIYAKEHDVFIIAYDKIITDTFAVDFYVGFNITALEQADISRSIDLDKVQQVKYGRLSQMVFYDTEVLAQTTIVLADRFLKNPPKFSNYVQVDNKSMGVSSLLISPIQITKDNYENILIKTDIVKASDLE